MILLYCPFCGSPAIMKSTYYGQRHQPVNKPRWFVACQNPKCGASMPPHPMQYLAIRRWNTRSMPP